MPKIELETLINAPIEVVFDSARSVDLHKLGAKQTNEEAIAGRTFGLIELGDTITWRAKHFGIYQTLTVEIIEFDRPNLFVDIMTKGIFKSMRHTHIFENHGSYTKMIDKFEFVSPFGLLGRIADILFLKKYMYYFLVKKNNILKEYAEKYK